MASALGGARRPSAAQKLAAGTEIVRVVPCTGAAPSETPRVGPRRPSVLAVTPRVTLGTTALGGGLEPILGRLPLVRAAGRPTTILVGPAIQPVRGSIRPGMGLRPPDTERRRSAPRRRRLTAARATPRLEAWPRPLEGSEVARTLPMERAPGPPAAVRPVTTPIRLRRATPVVAMATGEPVATLGLLRPRVIGATAVGPTSGKTVAEVLAGPAARLPAPEGATAPEMAAARVVRPATAGTTTPEQIGTPVAVRVVHAEMATLRATKATEGGPRVQVGVRPIPTKREGIACPTSLGPGGLSASLSEIRPETARLRFTEGTRLRLLGVLPRVAVRRLLLRAAVRLLTLPAVPPTFRRPGVGPLISAILRGPCAPRLLRVTKRGVRVTITKTTIAKAPVGRVTREVGPILLLQVLPAG